MKKNILYIILMFGSMHLNAKTITVNQDGSGNYTTIQAAASIAQAGDTIFISPGVYLEMVTATNSGTNDLPIVYLGSTKGKVVIDANKAERGYCLRILGKNYLHFENITATGAKWMGVEIQGASSNISFRNVEVTENNHPTEDWSYGLVIDGAKGRIQNIRIEKCKIHNNRAFGLYIMNEVHNVLVDSCHLHSNGHTFEDVADNIIIADWQNEANGPNGIEIRNCEINNATRQGISTWYAKNIWIHDCNFHHNGATAVQIEDGCTNFVVENNTMASNQLFYSTETGVWIDDAKYGVVRNNIIKHNQVGIKVSKSENVIVRHNTVFKNNQLNAKFKENGGITILAYDGIDNKNTALVHNTFYEIGNPSNDYMNGMVAFYEYENSQIKNCIFYNNIFSGITNGYHLVSFSSSGVPIRFTSDYNVIHDDQALKTKIQGTETSWSNHIATSKQEANSVFEAPVFVNAQNDDYKLSASSSGIDKGRFLTAAVNSGSGNEIVLENAMFFNDGYGITSGDKVQIGGNVVTIQQVDYLKNTIKTDRSISWQAKDQVSFAYNGKAPDMGAFEDGITMGFDVPVRETEGNLKLDVFPNPFHSTVTMCFSVGYSSDVVLEICDLSGKILSRIEEKCVAGQNYSRKWTANGGQKNGCYFVRLSTDKESLKRKIIKQN